MGEITLDMGPGASIWIAAGSCPGMVVCVNVGRGRAVRVGLGVFVSGKLGVSARAVAVPDVFSASEVNATTVGKYSGGYAVGMGLAVGAAQAAKSPRRETRRAKLRFIQNYVVAREWRQQRHDRSNPDIHSNGRLLCCVALRLRPATPPDGAWAPSWFGAGKIMQGSAQREGHYKP